MTRLKMPAATATTMVMMVEAKATVTITSLKIPETLSRISRTPRTAWWLFQRLQRHRRTRLFWITKRTLGNVLSQSLSITEFGGRRHEVTCLSNMRVFKATDNGTVLVRPGVVWHIGDKACVVLPICSFWIRTAHSPRAAPRSSTPVPSLDVIVRPEHLGMTSIKFCQMKKITAVSSFRKGKPAAVVDTIQAEKMTNMVARFVQNNESQRRYHSWSKISLLEDPPLTVRVCLPTSHATTAT